MKISYFTFEDIDSGLFRTQVWDLLSAVCSQELNFNIQLLIINRPWFLFKHLKAKRKIIRLNKNSNLKIKYIPLLPPLRYITKSSSYLNLVVQWLLLLLRISIPGGTKVIHCRSYLSTFIGLKLKNVDIIFDMRSLFPAENVSSGNLRINSKIYLYWLDIESYCIKKAKFTCVVSDPFKKYVEDIRPYSEIQLIPIIVNSSKLKFSEKNRKLIRSKMQWENKQVFVYSGSFGLSGINRSALINMVNQIINLSNSFHLLILSAEKVTSIESFISMLNTNKNNVTFLNAHLDEYGAWLSAADYGVHALPKQLDFKTRMSTKVTEYLTCGLPVIVNEYVGAAAELIMKFEIGHVMKENILLNPIEFEGILSNLSKIKRQNIIDIAIRLFSIKANLNKYIELYKNCN